MHHPIDHSFRARIHILDRQVPDLPDDLDAPFVFASESSNNSLDAYCTHMTERTLRNFAAGGAAGVQFLDSHNSRNLGYGRTFAGRFELVPDRSPDFSINRPGVQLAMQPPAQYMRAILETFTVPGIRFGGGLTYASTDDFIRAARAGIARDISVGFYGGDWICDICGNNYRSWHDCYHLAGFDYPVGEQGDLVVVATVAIDGAFLAEHSAVYDGATPQAMIIKAEEMSRAGELSPESKRLFEVRYHVDLPVSARRSFPATPLEKPMNVIQQLRDAGAPADVDSVDAGIAWLLNDRVALRAQIDELTPLAEQGRQYLETLREQVIAAGIRAMGQEFPADTYRAMLKNAGIEELKRLHDGFEQAARQRLPGGRQTADKHEPPAAAAPRANGVPDAAYKS